MQPLTIKPWLEELAFPLKLTPRQFQRIMANYALERNRSYLRADPGLGKTIVAALLQNSLRGTMIYISPPGLVLNVEEEFRKWCIPPVKISVNRVAAPNPKHGPMVWVIPDTMIHTEEVREHVRKVALSRLTREFTLIVDEAHRFKSLDARRSKALYQAYLPAFTRTIFMSGTPMPNRPMELWAVISNAAPEILPPGMNQHQFGLKYCAARQERIAGKIVWNYSGASNVEDLAARLHKNFMLVMRKEEVMPELPPKTEQIVFLGEGVPPRLAKMEKAILRENSPEDLMAGHFGEDTPVASYRRLLGEYKLDKAIEFIQDAIEGSNDYFLIFAYHRNTIALLNKALSRYTPLVITGETPTAIRHERVKQFQSDSGPRVLLANYLAAGIGLTLTKATRGIFVEFSWVPGENDQAIDRMHRIGQENFVLAQYLVFKDSLDATMLETNLRKRKDIAHI